MAEEIKQGMTRREVLKKGAVVGGTMGAVMWMAPAVRALDTTSAAAAIPSEGTCCLRVQIVSVTVVDFIGSGGLDDVLVNYRGRNCGPETIGSVDLLLEFSTDGGGSWSNAGTSFNPGSVAPGNFTETFQYVTDLAAASYLFRLSGTYKCDSGGDATLLHNIPQPYDYGGPAVIT